MDPISVLVIWYRNASKLVQGGLSFKTMGDLRRRKLTRRDIEEIVRLRKGTKTEDGWSYLRLAAYFHVHHTSILYWIKKANDGKSIWVRAFDGRESKGRLLKSRYVKKGGQGGVRVQYGQLKGSMYEDYLKKDRARKRARCTHPGMGSDSRSCFVCGYKVKI